MTTDPLKEPRIVAHQYRKVAEPGKPVKAWDSCGKFTYDKHKDLPDYEVRRLAIYDEVLRQPTNEVKVG